jgi:hypothetical protein
MPFRRSFSVRALIYIPFIVQAIVIGFDEFVFHVKRGLPKWERIGHPIDTLSVISCILFVLLVPYSSDLIKIYISLGVFSCLMVTKDEFVHKHHCPAAEHWTHALLFLNHPILLACMGLLWPEVASNPVAKGFLIVQAALIGLFFLYQIIYWNFIWKEKSTTPSTKS